jgi:hypothetical protein
MANSTVLLINFSGYLVFISVIIINVIVSKITYKGVEKCAA